MKKLFYLRPCHAIARDYNVECPESFRRCPVRKGRQFRQLDHRAITIKELCGLYSTDLNAGLILGKGGRPKKASTIYSDLGRMTCHILPLVGNRRVKDFTKADANWLLKDVMAGKMKLTRKTAKLRGKSIVGGGAGTASRTSLTSRLSRSTFG